MLKEDVICRIEELVAGRSLRKVSLEWGIPQPTLHNMLKNRTDPKFDTLDKIMKAENVNVEWLLTGSETENDFISIPRIDIEVSAGCGSYIVSELENEGMKVTQKWIINEGFLQADLVMMTAKGDSMEPSIPSGASLIIDKSQTSIKEDGVYVLRVEDALFVKRLRYDHLNYELNIISDNPIYPLSQVKKAMLNDICVIGKVVKLVVNF
ncbi:hypothetical protein HWQ46_16985 [Shewanella sp. D64]|uniref:XRE family transcriptional regulator n=1 Tax=unclassified Shewanella TaxID=196818 RepID=UPI0022BA376E|nr:MULTISPECIES: XRE family transcriptional regulator [unclassified Shewanella]MEC4727243.1 hypothetical protein [Shewanella sp. D64]MEC4739398.1 hypothetical protein [Shewanella sp. E94]WBJ96727.1 hypothetical protein HWQ47_06320 [Shewanella sp. MTB7]